MKVVTSEEMRAIEDAAVARGITLTSLMDRAGAAVAGTAAELGQGGQILVLAGPGNNGGDGVIAATLLEKQRRRVTVYTFRRPNVGSFPGRVVAAEDDPDQTQLNDLLQGSAVIVDALLGIGKARPIEGLLAELLRRVNRQRSPNSRAIAVDIPTGVNADTGAVAGEAFRADLTLCMGFLKCGDVLYPGADYVGQVRVVDVGIPVDLAADIPVFVPSVTEIASLLPLRRSNSNKGTYGRVLFVGGSRNFMGAPSLAAMAAYRVGAGLVDVAVPQAVQASVAGHVIEAVFTPLADEEGRISPRAMTAIEEALSRADAAIFGPGLGLSDLTVEVTRRYLAWLDRHPSTTSVIDADGLNALSRIDGWWETKASLVLTPHPGEMSRLASQSIAAIQADRLNVARSFAHRWGEVVVLKGAGTVIASPNGEAAINPTGGPNLAAAGTGDVLSGIIGGLLAQGCAAFPGAVVGAYLHGQAGDMLRREHGDAGTVASDLLPILPSARVTILEQG